MDSTKLLLIAFLVTTSQAGPVYKLQAAEEKRCALTCSESNKFNYEPGNIYEFTYNAETKTKMNGASEDSAFMVIDANFEIEPITKCDFVMRIGDATLRDSGDALQSQTFKEAMMKKPLKFSFQDGRIDHICAMDGESTWTLNIKRGILSAFQNSMDNFDHSQNLTETDVVGTCISEYKITEKDAKTKFVEKSKNLLSCSDREGYRMAIQSIGYNVPSFVKSLPLMKSEYKCTQTLDLDSNILQSTTCLEEHVFRPFSSGKNGAMTTSEQTLTFVNRKRAGRPSNEQFRERSTLLFHHQHDTPSKQEKEDKIEAKLQELCEKATEDIRPEVPEMVNQLIEHMRQVDRDVLSRVYNKINQKSICANKADRIKQYFHDAIPMVGTESSVGMIQDLISRKHVTGSEAEMWLLSLSFVHHPSKEMVAAIMPLLDEHDVSGNILLAVSSLASSYCNERPECGKDSEISTLIRKLMHLTHDCNDQNVDARKIVFALRALGNIGHSHEAVSHLSRCFTRQDVSDEIRIAAMDAFRRIPCDAVRSDLMGLFRDESEDSELRINAYIGLMKCPSKDILSKVRQVLEKEKSNQVGSFVWSHLTNLMETSDPHMQDIRNIVQDEELKKEFNLDQRKFSRNYEGSFFFDSINTGAKVDSNVIFSQKSFIPRSANLNLTIDLFGHAINFLEFGGRVQGLERMLEQRYTYTRRLKEKVKLMMGDNKFGETDEFRASTYLRVFGNEIRYWNTTDYSKIKNPIINLLTNHRLELDKTMAFGSDGVVIPTCIGLPLNLSLTATGSVHFNRSRDSIKDKEMYQIKLTPSAALQIKGEMTVDAHLSKAGLKMVTVAHTSTAVILKFSWKKVSVDFPKAKTEFFNIKSDFFIVQRSADKKQKMLNKNMRKFTICSGNAMKSGIGLRLCQHLQFPNASLNTQAPYFPFTGPAIYDLHMKNEDVPNGFVMAIDSDEHRISFDTPGSKISRLVTMDLEYVNRSTHVTIVAPWKNFRFEGKLNSHYETLELGGLVSMNNKNYSLVAKLNSDGKPRVITLKPYLSLDSPTRKMLFQGVVIYDHMKSFKLDVNSKGFGPKEIDLKASGSIVPEEIKADYLLTIGKNQYQMTSRIGRSHKDAGFQYSPYVKVSVPSRTLVELTSEVTYDPLKKFTLDFKLEKLFSRLVTLNVFAAHNAAKGKNMVKVQFRAPRANFRVIGDFSKKKSAMSGRVITFYTFGQRYSDRLTFSGKLRDLSLKNSARYLGSVELSSKKKVFLNFKLNGQLAKTTNHMETKFALQYGNPKDKAKNTLAFSAVVNRSLKTFIHAYSYTMAIKHAGQNLDYKMEAKHVQSAKWPFKKFENNIMIQIAPGKVVQTKLSYNIAKVKGLPTYESEVALSYPGRDMKMANKLMQVNKNTYENHFTVQWQKGREATVQSTYTKTGKDIHNIENMLRLPNKKEAKASAMLQVTRGAYKAKLHFSADKEMITRQQINYMAEGGVTYTFNAKQMSSDANAELMWAPNKKISANVNFDYMKRNSFSSQLAFSTPFDAMKTFDGKVKYIWANGKYTSMMSMSWNNENQLKQEFSFVYPDFHLSYDAFALLSGKKSEVGLSMKYSDMSLNGNLKASHNKNTIINVILKYTSPKSGNDGELGLDFDIIDYDGKMKITFKYDKQRGKVMSSGEGKFNLPLQQLRQIGGSYNLKHNNDVSSLDMSFSSSLRNYRNGKMSFEMNRNLPKMLKTTMDLTLNGNPMFKLDTNYGRQRDDIDMKVEITPANGKKITASGNLNFSGKRKTANVEMKSSFLQFSVDGAFEYQGTRSAETELKLTLNGKNLMMRSNYKKEGTTYKATGTLGLPDGRSLKMEGSLDLENIAASLKTMTPDFPQLTEIDMAFSFNGDKRIFRSTASLKVMPYIDTTQVEMKFNKKQFSIEMKSKFESMKQAKITVTYDGDWVRSQKVKSIFQLDNEQMFEFDMDYNFNSIQDFAVSMEALASHRRYKEFQFVLKNKGSMKNMQSNLKLKLSNGIMFDAMFQNSRRASKLSLNGQVLDFDEWKSTFELKGDLNFMTVSTITSIGKQEVNKIEFSLKQYGRMINVKVTGPNAVNFDFNMDLDTETITFNMASTFTMNGREKYTMSALYEHLSKLEIKTSIPSYNDELLVTFSGPLKAFNMHTKFSHNDQVYDLMLSNKEYYRQMKATLNTPYFQDTALFKFEGDLSNMNILAKVMHDNERFQLTFSNSGYYQQIDAKLDTPYFQPMLKFSLLGNARKFNFEFMMQFDKHTYEMKAFNEDYFQKMNFLLNTPFLNMDFQFEGDLDNTKGTFTILYDNRKYELTFSNKDFFQVCSLTITIPKHVIKVNGNLNLKMKATSGDFTIMYNKKKVSLSGNYKDLGRKKIIKADLNTPYFKDSLSATVSGKPKKFNAEVKLLHEGDTYELTISNKNFYEMIDLNIYAPGIEAKLDFEGELKKFKSFVSVKIMNDMYSFGLSNDNYIRNIQMEMTSPQTGKVMFSYDLQGNLNNFKLTSQFSYKKNMYEINIVRDIKTGEHRMTISGPQININGHFNGDLKSFSFNANVVLKNEKYEIMASTKNYFREISAKMATPQLGEQSLSVKINGELSDFNGFIEVKNNNDVYRSDFSLANNEFRLSLPKLLQKLQVKLNGNWKNFDFVMQLMDYNGERIELSASNKNFKELKAHATIPQLKDIDFLVKTSGNLRNGEAMMKMSYGENMFENEIEISFDGRQASFKLEPHYNILGRSGKSKLNVDLMFDDQSYKYEFEADIEGTQVNSMASIKISSEVSVLMTLNIPTFDSSEMKLRIVSEGFQKTDMMLNLKSPWTGMTKIFYEHNGEMGKLFSTKGYVERDDNRLASYLLDTYFAKDYSFDFKCDYNSFQHKIEIKGDLKFQGLKTLATLSAITPFRRVKEFFIAVQTKMLRDGPNVELDMKIPNQQYSLNIDLSKSNFHGLLNVNMDKRNKDKQYQFQTSYKNTDQHADVSRSLNIKTVFPERTVSFDSRFENTQDDMVMSSHLTWDESQDQKVGFELMLKKGRENEAKLRVITPRRTIELFGKVEVNGNHCSTMGHIMMDINNQAQKIDVKADITTSSDRADIDLTVKFPNQKNGMNLKTSINVPNGNIIFSSKSEFSMDQDPQKTFKMSTKLMSESKGKRDMYTLQMDAGHASTGFAIDMTGRVSKSPEKYNADVEMGYLNLRNERQKFAVRGEMQRISREINLKLEAPSKTIELDGSLRNGNRYMMSVLKKESGKENMEALFKLNPNAKRMNIVFNYDEANPDKLYRIDADIVKSRATLKAYRSNKQRKQSVDGRITVELKTNNLFQSHIKWNPDLLEELNTFAFEKLSLYGREMKSFGDSLGKVIDSEISTRFNLIERSFSEDMEAIGNYFDSEYRSMSAEFKHVVRYMKQVIYEDSFYAKSAMIAITNAYDEMWFNYNNGLIKLRHEMEQFNQYLNNQMDEAKKEFDFYYGKYSMQLMNKVNELLDECLHQYDLLYERAMEMKSDIDSFIRDYPDSMKELIEKLRQYPNGKKLIDIVMSMYEMINEKKMQAKDHMNTLTNSIYSAHATLNRHISKVRQYPIVDAIMDAINEVYQQALWSYNYWDVKDNVLGLKNTLYKVGAEKIKEIKDIVTDIGMNTLVFDPKRGEIIVKIRFGAAKYAFNHFMSSVEDVERAVMKLSNMMPNMDFNVWDIYYMMKPSSDLYDNIPPFKAEASLFVGHHITTFDGRHLNYKGTCSYLLARDFVDGNFTVVANFNADRRSKTLKSLSVTTAHNEQLEIFPDNTVLLNRRVAKLPLQLTDATVRRQGNLIVIQSKRGYKVMCDHDNELYTVQVSGWYFNKMAGLFGNYNNEPMDDMLMSNNRYTNDLEQFAESWSVSRQCRSHRNFAPSHMVPENMECARLFLQTDSPYRYCFKQVDPSQFYKICAMQLSSSKATPIELCKITSYYMKNCETKGVYLSTPYMCPII